MFASLDLGRLFRPVEREIVSAATVLESHRDQAPVGVVQYHQLTFGAIGIINEDAGNHPGLFFDISSSQS